VAQAERKVRPSTLEPDLDNANGGMSKTKSFEQQLNRWLLKFVFVGDWMVRINGEDCDAEGKTVAEYLALADYDLRLIVVERNGEIVPKGTYAEALLQDGDVVEVVRFVGGG